MTERVGKALALALTTFALGLGEVSFATNLLPNYGFNRDISGWTTRDGSKMSLVWSGLDAEGSTGSGSLEAMNRSPDDFLDNFIEIARFCIPVSAGETYHAGANFYLPGGQSQGAYFLVGLNFEPDAFCNAPGANFQNGVLIHPAANTWQHVDTQPFTAPAGAVAAEVLFSFQKVGAGGSVIAYLDDAVFEAIGSTTSCFTSTGYTSSGDGALLCLGSRFTVTATWNTATGSGGGAPVQLSSDTGYFWFFSPANLEAVAKVLNGCGVNGKYWVFAGGLTNVGVHLTVTDRATGRSKSYQNPSGHAFQPIQDTAALAACP